MLLSTSFLTVNTGWLSLSALSCLGLSVFWLAWKITYDLFFHPLSHIPGPVWGKFTRIPFQVTGIMGTQVPFMQGLHEKYGSVVRFAPDELSYTDEQAWKDIYGHQKGREENLKGSDFQ